MKNFEEENKRKQNNNSFDSNSDFDNMENKQSEETRETIEKIEIENKSSNNNDKNNKTNIPNKTLRNIDEEKYEEKEGEEKKVTLSKRIKVGSAIMFVVGIIAIFASNTPNIDISPEAQSALDSPPSAKNLPKGTILSTVDSEYVGGDLTIEHDSNEETTKLWVWDYASEDGDYVEVIVDGVSLGSAFMIKNKPVSFDVPTVSEIKVVGVKDGGGGITYAVHYDMNNKTYFNGVDLGENNTYTLMRKQPTT